MTAEGTGYEIARQIEPKNAADAERAAAFLGLRGLQVVNAIRQCPASLLSRSQAFPATL